MPEDTVKEPFYIREMMDGVAKKMTPDLRKHAKRSGWPEEVANSLRFDHVGGMLMVHSDTVPMEQIEALEYGGPDAPPQPAITNYLTAYTTKRRTIKEVSANGDMMAKVVNKWFS